MGQKDSASAYISACVGGRDGPLDRETDGIMIGSEGVRAKSLLLPGAGSGLAASARTLASARVVTLPATNDAEMWP